MARKRSGSGDLAKEVAALELMDLNALRERWRAVVGTPPPRCRSPYVFRYEIAWVLQAKVHGDLDASTRRGLRAGAKATTPESVDSTAPTSAALSVGATLLREWRGETHRVKITAEGFEHLGKLHRSLSSIAREITGARWSGPRFFQITDIAA